LNIIQKTAKINSIFLVILLIAGTFAGVYPSFILGIQAQSEYEYENENRYDDNNNNNSYNSAEYPSQQPYEYPQQQAYDEYEDDDNNNYNDNYYYPSTEEEPISADIVVPNDFETIQEAIDAADEGDIIIVLPGTYSEQITISKSLTIIGSGAKSTIIEVQLPLEELELNVIERPYIVEVNNGAEVTLKGFTIQGLEGTDCGQLIAVSVLEDGTIDLKHAIVNGCTDNAILIGAPPFFPGGPQVGHATLTKIFVTDYQNHGVFAIGLNTTLTMAYNKITSSNPNALATIGILFLFGATGTITNNEVSKNICNIPDICGPDFLNQLQAFGIVADSSGNGSVISNNYISKNDGGIALVGESGCCLVEKNKLQDNRFFGITVVDGDHTIANTKILGGKVGTAAIAFSANATATLDQVKIVGTEIPIQALSSGNLTAEVNVLSPSFFEP
jgi:parallel beta-helix repeat protein